MKPLLKRTKRIFLALALLGLGVPAAATVTIVVGSSGWGDEEAPARGLAWGIVVDSDGNVRNGGFGDAFLDELASALDGFQIPDTATFSNPVLLFDEYYFVRARELTQPAFPGDDENEGYMGELGLNFADPVEPGDDFGLLWFSTGAGTLSSSHYFGFQPLGQLPADGATVTDLKTSPGLARSPISNTLGDGGPGGSNGGGDSDRSWYTGAFTLEDNWHYLAWFENFKPEGRNWIYHGRHGWLYVLAEDTSGMFLWDDALGRWLWTNRSIYPWLYAYGPDRGWVFFYENGSPGSRLFYRADTGQIIAEYDFALD